MLGQGAIVKTFCTACTVLAPLSLSPASNVVNLCVMTDKLTWTHRPITGDKNMWFISHLRISHEREEWGDNSMPCRGSMQGH